MGGLPAQRLVSAIGCVALWASVAAGASEAGRSDFREAAERACESVVLVVSHVRNPMEPGRDCIIGNTGFFVDTEGRVLTSLLAVSGSTRIEVQAPGADAVQARIQALDQAVGLALLETGLEQTVPFQRREEPLQAGQWVLAACGARSPEGGAQVALCAGMVSACEAAVKLSGVRWDGLLQAELAPRLGLAAGPLLDRTGRLAGVIVGARTSADSGCCYALPVTRLDSLLERLLRRESRRLGWLGLAVAPSPQTGGLAVRGVLGGSPAHVVGIMPGDILLEFDGEPVRDPSMFESKVVGAAPGSRVELSLLSGREVKRVSVAVGTRPLLISRMPVTARRGVRMFSRGIYVRGPDPSMSAADREIIEQLRQENEELRRRIAQIEERLERLEGESRGEQP